MQSAASGTAGNIPRLYVVRFFFWLHFHAAVLVLFYTERAGLTLTHVLSINAWFMFWNFVLEVPTGTVADFLGRKFSLALGSVVAVGAALLYVSTTNFFVFLCAEILFAVAYSLHSGADEALAYDSLQAGGRASHAKTIFARMESCKLAGIVIGAATGGWLAHHYGLAGPLTAYAIPAALAALAALTLRDIPPAERAERPAYMTILREGTSYLLGHRVLLVLALELALTNALVWGIIWLYQPLLKASGIPTPYFGAVHAAAVVAQIVLLAGAAHLENLLRSKRRLLLALTAGAGLTYGVLAFAAHPLVVVPAIVCTFAFGLSRLPLFSAYMNHHIPSDKRATVLSLASMLRTAAIVVVNPLIGFAADYSLATCVGVLGVMLVLLPLFSRIEEDHLLH